MIAPKGFLHFGEILEMSRWYARDMCWAFRTKSREDGRVWEVEQSAFERDAVQCWLISQLVVGRGIHICSAGGVPLRCSSVDGHHEVGIALVWCPVPPEKRSG